MQPGAEKQQDHAEFGELTGQALVGNESRRERTYQDTSHEVTDQGREAKAVCERAENEGEAEPRNKDGNKRRVRHFRERLRRGRCAAARIKPSGEGVAQQKLEG